MKIQSVAHPRAIGEIKRAENKPFSGSKGDGSRIKDRVEIAASTRSGDVVLESVKAKIRRNYYSSENVLDDLSEKFAKLFSS